MTDQHKLRRANAYALLKVDNETPLTPEMVRRMLDAIPSYADICEMRIDDEPGAIPKRRAAIYYTTTMPWENN